MNKLFQIMLSLTLCFLCLPISTYAVDISSENISIISEDNSERATGLIDDRHLSIFSGSKCVNPDMITYGSATMSEIGFKSVRVQRSSDQVTWSTEVNLNTIVTTNAPSYSYYDSISVEGGYYYRIILIHYAKDYSGNTQVESNTSNSVWVS